MSSRLKHGFAPGPDLSTHRRATEPVDGCWLPASTLMVLALLLSACGSPSGDGKRGLHARHDLLPQIPLSATHDRVVKAEPDKVAVFVDMVGGPGLSHVGEHACMGTTYPWSPWREQHAMEEVVVPERNPQPEEPSGPVPHTCLRLPANLRAIDLVNLLIGITDLAPPRCQGSLLIACRASGGEEVWVQADGLRWGGPTTTLHWSGGELEGQEITIAVLAAEGRAEEPRVGAVGDSGDIVYPEVELWTRLSEVVLVPPRAIRRDFRLLVEDGVTLGDLLPTMLRLEEACRGRARVGIPRSKR